MKKRAVGFFLVLAGPKENRKAYFRMACGLLRSMVDKLTGLSCPIIIGHDGLLATDMAILKRIYRPVEFYRIDTEPYEKAGKTNPRYYLLDVFHPRHNCEKMILLGADMLCIGRTDRLIYRDYGPIAMWYEPKRGTYNSGCMVLRGEGVLNEKTYHKLVAGNKGGEFGTDQGIINNYFRGKIARLPDETQIAVDDATVRPGRAMFLHFWRKPFGAGQEWKQIHPECRALLDEYMGRQAFEYEEDECESAST